MFDKLSKNNKVVTIFFGDGATEEGVFFESLDFASLHNLKILFVCENNFFSVYSGINSRQSKKRNILSISKSFGIKSFKTDGNDCLKIYDKIKKIIKDIRSNKGPALISLDTYRWLEHCGPNNDDNLNYRDKNEINYWLKRCPVEKLKKYLFRKKKLDIKNYKKINLEIDKEIKNAFEFARKGKFPLYRELNKDIYI